MVRYEQDLWKGDADMPEKLERGLLGVDACRCELVAGSICPAK